MIGVYYTGANMFLEEQRDVRLSLGGFISNSLIPNGTINNIFSDISESAASNPIQIVRGFALQNQTGVDITGLRLWLNPPMDSLITVEVAVITVNRDQCGHAFLPQLPNENALPYVGVFQSVDGESNAITIGSVPNQEYIGFWVKRTIAPIANSQRDCDALLDAFDNGVVQPTTQTFELVLDWL